MVAVLFLLPQFVSRFYVYLGALILVTGLLATSLNMVLGFGGMYQFHHAVFYGIGAYAFALTSTKSGLPVWVGYLAAPVVAALLSLVMGIITVRSSEKEIRGFVEEKLKDQALMTVSNLETALQIADRKTRAEVAEPILNGLAEITVGKTGYMYILNEKGDYVLSYKRQRDGENIMGARDADGHLFIQEIVSRGTRLQPGQAAVTYYPWQNKGESSARMKLAGYTWFPEWGWVVASSV